MTNELRRDYNIPLRKEFLKVARFKKTKKAVKAVKEFAAKHMKVDIKNVLIGKQLNEELWKNGIKNPPHHVKVTILKDIKENKVMVELQGEKVEFFKQKEEKKKGVVEKAKEKFGIKDKAKKEEDDVLAELKGGKKGVKEEKEEDKEETEDEKVTAEDETKVKEIEKEEVKEMKKEATTKHDHRPKSEFKDKKPSQNPNAPKSF